MSHRHIASILAAVLLVSAAGIGGAIAAPTVSSEHTETAAHAGTHVAFDTEANAIANYSVNGETVIDSVQVESASAAENRGLIGADVGLETATSVNATPIALETESDTRFTLTADSGAALQAHDSQRGHLVVESSEVGALLTANVSGEAEQDGDARVVVTHENGTQGTFVLVGDGEATVNEHGNVTAELGQDARLVYRQYHDERSEADADREEMIANGTAAAEVYVTAAAEGSSDAAADVVSYADDTTVEVTTYSENRIEMTAERTEHDGRVVVTSVSEEAFGAAEDIEVRVDGEAAAQVASTSELVAATEDGDNSAYMVRQRSAAEGRNDVLVGVNHFSERDVTLANADRSSSSDDGMDDTSDQDDEASPLPGFGVGVALVALLTAAMRARRNLN